MRKEAAVVPLILVLLASACQTAPGAEYLNDYAPDMVEIRVQSADDLLYLRVGPQYHLIGYWGMPEDMKGWRDVTSWFAGGKNDVALWGTNWGNPAGFDFELRVNGRTVTSRSRPTPGAATREWGVWAFEGVDVPKLRLPPLTVVTVRAGARGAIYVDDEYTGLYSPASLRLPAGKHRIGLGVSSDVPGAYEGRFYERLVQVGGDAIVLDMDASAAPLGVQNVVRIAILPVKHAVPMRGTGQGTLTQVEVDTFCGQVLATRKQWVLPFSYGLTDWDVTVLPMEESIVERDGEVLRTQKYADLFSDYDVVVLYGPSYDADGTYVEGLGGGAWSSGQEIRFNSDWVDAHGAGWANEGVLHEMLHQYDGDQREWMHHYTGVHELHGVDEHGYLSTYLAEEGRDWLVWYRAFMRGQVAEMGWMTGGKIPPERVTARADRYVGTFHSIRWGMDTPGPQEDFPAP